jgi:hypothetical protein
VTPAALPPGAWAEPGLGATIGKSSAIAAAVLKTFRLIIVGSIYGNIGPNRFNERTFPSPRIDCALAELGGPELYAA